MLGRDFKGRGARMEECLQVLRDAFTAEPFEYQGRKAWVRPAPFSKGGPPIFMGGRSKRVIGRAARFGLGVMTEGGTGLEPYYREQCEKHGTTPGMFIDPPTDGANSLFVAEDPDAAWADYGPYLLHDAKMYGQWMGSDHDAITKSTAMDVDALRAEAGNYRILSVDEAIAWVRERGMLALQPLCGGLPPELAWKSLRLVAERVVPAIGS